MSQPQPYLLKAAEYSGSKPNKELLPWVEMSSARHKPSGCRIWEPAFKPNSTVSCSRELVSAPSSVGKFLG